MSPGENALPHLQTRVPACRLTRTLPGARSLELEQEKGADGPAFCIQTSNGEKPGLGASYRSGSPR